LWLKTGWIETCPQLFSLDIVRNELDRSDLWHTVEDISLQLGVEVRVRITTVALLYTNWQLAVVTLAVVPLLVGFTWWFIRVIEPRYTRHRSVIGDLNTRIENGLSGCPLYTSDAADDSSRVDPGGCLPP
jgi:ABC-type multidrug transport system fused ATPase/permease subunit